MSYHDLPPKLEQMHGADPDSVNVGSPSNLHQSQPYTHPSIYLVSSSVNVEPDEIDATAHDLPQVHQPQVVEDTRQAADVADALPHASSHAISHAMAPDSGHDTPPATAEESTPATAEKITPATAVQGSIPDETRGALSTTAVMDNHTPLLAHPLLSEPPSEHDVDVATESVRNSPPSIRTHVGIHMIKENTKLSVNMNAELTELNDNNPRLKLFASLDSEPALQTYCQYRKPGFGTHYGGTISLWKLRFKVEIGETAKQPYHLFGFGVSPQIHKSLALTKSDWYVNMQDRFSKARPTRHFITSQATVHHEYRKDWFMPRCDVGFELNFGGQVWHKSNDSIHQPHIDIANGHHRYTVDEVLSQFKINQDATNTLGKQLSSVETEVHDLKNTSSHVVNAHKVLTQKTQQAWEAIAEETGILAKEIRDVKETGENSYEVISTLPATINETCSFPEIPHSDSHVSQDPSEFTPDLRDLRDLSKMLRHFLAALTAQEVALAAITSFAAAVTSVGLYIELTIIIRKIQNKMCVGFICLVLCHVYMSPAFVLLLPIATLNVVVNIIRGKNVYNKWAFLNLTKFPLWVPVQVQKLLTMGVIPLPYFISYNAMKLAPYAVWMNGVYLIGSYGHMVVSKAPLTQTLTLLFNYLWMIAFFQWIYTTKEESFYDVFARTTDGFNQRFNITPCIELESQVVGKTGGLE